MYVRRLSAAALVAGHKRPTAATTAHGEPASLSWEAALAALAAKPSPANQLAALRAIPEVPNADAAKAAVERCTTLQRYDDAAVAAAFPALCDARRHAAMPPEPAVDVLQRAIARGSYVDSAHFGPLLRLLNATSARPGPDVLYQWGWMRHTRAHGCPIARTALVVALASHHAGAAGPAKALEEEAAMRKDGVLLREEGLTALLDATARADWASAVALVEYWRSEHRAAESTVEDGRPGAAALVSLLQLLRDARKTDKAREILASLLADVNADVRTMTVPQLAATLNAVLPGCSPQQMATEATAADAVRAVVEAAREVAWAPDVSLSDEGVPELLGAVGAAAALLKERQTLLAVADRLVELTIDQATFEAVLAGVVSPLRGTAWQVGKLAVAELARVTQLSVPTSVLSRLVVLHEAVEADKDAVLDACLGAESRMVQPADGGEDAATAEGENASAAA